MTREIQLPLMSLPTTVYCVIRDGVGKFWNSDTLALEDYNAANWADYAVALTQLGSSIFYDGTFPATLAAGCYRLYAFIQAGGSPSVTDDIEGFIGVDDQFYWDGASLASLDEVNVAKVAGSSAASLALAAFWAGQEIGVAQDGDSNTITLADEASSVTDAYVGMSVVILSGTGAKQVPRRITAYNGTTKVATLSKNWPTTPDDTSVYALLGLIE